MKNLNIFLFTLFFILLSSTLTAQTPPQAIILGDTAFCAGDSTQLFAVPGNFPKYIWSTGDTTQSIFVKTAGVYTVRVVDSMGNTGPLSNSQRTIILSLPAKPTISGDPGFCQGSSTTLTASPANLPKYQWSTQDSTNSIVVSQAATFTVSAIDANGCKSIPSDPLSVVENPLPLKPEIMGDSAICQGDSALVGIIQPFYASYSWSNGDSTQSIWVTMGSMLSLSVRDTNGCQSPLSDIFTVREDMRPGPPAIGGDTIFCEGDSLLLSAPNGQAGYLWSTGATTQTIWVKNSGTYALRITNQAGCISPFSLPWQIRSEPVPARPSISQQGGDSLRANSPAQSYTWLFNGQLLPNTSETLIASQSGLYRVIAQNGDCISDTSAAFSFVATTIDEPFVRAYDLYPNPTSDKLFILFPEKREVQILVMDLSGRSIFTRQLSLDATGLGQIDVQSLKSGYYFLQIDGVWKKFLKK